MDVVTLIIFLPLAGALLLLLFPRGAGAAIRGFSLLVSLVVFVISIRLLTGFETNAEMQFLTHVPWIPSLGISYKVGVDGLSLFLVLLVTFLQPIMILSAFRAITDREKEF